MGYTFYLTLRGLLILESCYRSRSREGWWVPRSTSSVFQGHFLRGGHYAFFRQFRVNSSDRGGEAASTGSGEVASTGEDDSRVLRGSMFPASSLSSHIFPFQHSGSHSFLISAFTVMVDTQ